ncbi:hypothetical protein [Chryseobacterium nepalense]|uniref:hypothetical protein n=1 Tax=Chryseobacterium nepalense TaxID=1854498 RepID=UPI002E00404B|nr:hypothetical protein [Chryseobacterium nepalense]
MKTFLLILKILRWFLGILFLLIALGLLIEQEIGASTIVLIMAVFIIPLSAQFIVNKLYPSFDRTNRILRSINYSEYNTILSTYQQNVLLLKKPLSEKKNMKCGIKIYHYTLSSIISNFHINALEVNILNDIKNYFNLSDQQIYTEKNKLAEKTLKSLIQKCYDDNRLTDAENQQIISLSTFLQFPRDRTEAIKNKVAFSLFNKILDEKISAEYLSPIKETELKQIIRDLKIDQYNIKTFISERKIRKLKLAKLLWNLDHGIFPIIYNPPILLNRDEVCYININATLIENKIVHTGYSRSSSSVSFRIAKGVNARVGGGRYRPVKENVRQIYPGNLFLTSSRLIFNAGGKSFQIPFNKLISYERQGSNFEFIVQNKNYLLRLNHIDHEILSIGIRSATRQFKDSNDQIKAKAMREISTNEILI